MSKIKNKFRISRNSNPSGYLKSIAKVGGNGYNNGVTYFNNYGNSKLKTNQNNSQQSALYNIDLEGLFQISDEEYEKSNNNHSQLEGDLKGFENMQKDQNGDIMQNTNQQPNTLNQHNTSVSRLNLRKESQILQQSTNLDILKPIKTKSQNTRMGKQEVQVKIKEFVPILLKRNIVAEYISPNRDQNQQQKSSVDISLNQHQIVERYFKNNGYPRRNERLLSDASRNNLSMQSQSTHFLRPNLMLIKQDNLNQQSQEGLPIINNNHHEQNDNLEINSQNPQVSQQQQQFKNLKYANELSTSLLGRSTVYPNNLKQNQTEKQISKQKESHKRLIRELQEKINAAKNYQDYEQLRLSIQNRSDVDPSSLYGKSEKEKEIEKSHNIQKQISKRYKLNLKNFKKQILAAQQANQSKIDDQSMIQMISFVTNYPKRHLNKYLYSQSNESLSPNKNSTIDYAQNASLIHNNPYSNLANPYTTNQYQSHGRSLSFAVEDNNQNILLSDQTSYTQSDREKLDQIMSNYKSPPEFNNSFLNSIIESEKKKNKQSIEQLKDSLAKDESISLRKVGDNMKQDMLVIQGGRFRSSQKENYRTIYNEFQAKDSINNNNDHNYYQTMYNNEQHNSENKNVEQISGNQYVLSHSIVLGGSLCKSLQSIDIKLKPQATNNNEKIRLQQYTEAYDQNESDFNKNKLKQQNLQKYLRKNANIQQLPTITRNHKFYEDQMSQPQPFPKIHRVTSKQKIHNESQHYKTLSKSFDTFNTTHQNHTLYCNSSNLRIQQVNKQAGQPIQSIHHIPHNSNNSQQIQINQKGAVPLPKVQQQTKQNNGQVSEIILNKSQQNNSSLINSTLQNTMTTSYNFVGSPPIRSQNNSFKQPRQLHQSIQNQSMGRQMSSKIEQGKKFSKQNDQIQQKRQLKPKQFKQNFSYLDDALIEEDLRMVDQLYKNNSLEQQRHRATNINKQQHSTQDPQRDQKIQNKVPESMPNMIKITITKNSNREQTNSSQQQHSDQHQQELSNRSSGLYNNKSEHRVTQTPYQRVQIKKELNELFKQNFNSIENNNYDKFLTASNNTINANRQQQSNDKQHKRNRSRNLSNSMVYQHDNEDLDLQGKSNQNYNVFNNDINQCTGW